MSLQEIQSQLQKNNVAIKRYKVTIATYKVKIKSHIPKYKVAIMRNKVINEIYKNEIGRVEIVRDEIRLQDLKPHSSRFMNTISLKTGNIAHRSTKINSKM